MPSGDNNKKYQDHYPDILAKMFSNGESVAEVCVALGISRRAFYDWVKKYPDFEEAYEMGRLHSEAWWTKLGRAGASGQVNINSTAWIFNMKNRFSWSDKIAEEKDETATPLTININGVDASVER
jgi:hypothetical protein